MTAPRRAFLPRNSRQLAGFAVRPTARTSKPPASTNCTSEWSSLAALRRAVISCELCPRLRAHCLRVARDRKREFQGWSYWGRPVPGLGDPRATLLVVGLAPAAHGGNRTGRV